MAFIIQHKHNIYISGSNKLCKLDVNTQSVTSTFFPEESNTKATITALAVSLSGKRIAAASSDKQLAIFNSTDLKLQEKLTTARSTSRISFTNQEEILLADKTGDVYLYTSVEPHKNLLLGHLSVVLDVQQSDCTKYIITCDRDEKIRVSRFPNCYNIESYCLGHKEFISRIQTFDELLISGSGDGTLRLWNFAIGKQLDMVDTNACFECKGVLEEFRRKMQGDKVEVAALPVTDLQVYKNGDDVWCCVSVLGFKGLLLYKVTTDQKLSFVVNLLFKFNVMAFSLGELLIVLTEKGFSVFKCASDGFVEISLEMLSKFYEEHVDLFGSIKTQCEIDIFYKRKFDNVQEYLEKKKSRIK